MSARIITFGDVDPRSLAQLERCIQEHGSAGVLCADHHLGYSMPIGGVAAYPEHISPSGVGYDIACGNKAVRTNLRAEKVVGAVTGRIPQGAAGETPPKITATDISQGHEVTSEGDLKNGAPARAHSTHRSESLSGIMEEIVRRVSFGIGRINNEPADHPVLDSIRDAAYPWQRSLLDLAAGQLGTVGAGNHYVDLLADEEGWLWVGVHFGSRGFGHKTATHFLELAGRRDDSMDAPPVMFESASEIGQAYVQAMKLAGAYAYAGRDLVVAKVLDILGAQATLEIHNHHNFAWQEEHGGQSLWVVRKGATPAFPTQLSFVGGSMGEESVILEGVESEKSRQALFSTVHGAGRAMSRSEAAGKVKRRTVWACGVRDCDGEVPIRVQPQPACPKCGGRMHRWQVREIVRPGRVDWPAWQARLAAAGIVLLGGGADEAPEAYKRLPEVLSAHEGTIRIVHRLRPLGVAMAGPDTIDPYKD